MSPQQLLAHADDGTLWPAASGLDVATAYRHALAVRALRIARGERPVGIKVGFTNRGIWPRYGVHEPMWGTVWNSTLTFAEFGSGVLSLAGTCQPRIEPECVFGIDAAPPDGASLDELFACIGWIAPGLEIVQSHQPGWRFAVADTVADGGLHARLLVGARSAARDVASDARAFDARLAEAGVALHCGDRLVERGRGANVLDGPLQALLHVVQALRSCPGAPGLQPGDVVTTGTWTDAWPVAPGEHWSAAFDAPLSRLDVRFERTAQAPGDATAAFV